MIMADLTRNEYIMLEGYSSMFPKRSHDFFSDYRIVGSKNSLLYLEYHFDENCLFPHKLVHLGPEEVPHGNVQFRFQSLSCHPCPRGQYSDRGGSTHCTDCMSTRSCNKLEGLNICSELYMCDRHLHSRTMHHSKRPYDSLHLRCWIQWKSLRNTDFLSNRYGSSSRSSTHRCILLRHQTRQ